MADDLFTAMIKAKPIEYERNPWWRFTDGQIDTYHEPVHHVIFEQLGLNHPTLKRFFQSYWYAQHSEAQVLILTEKDAHKLKLPKLPDVLGYYLSNDLVMVVPPQENTYGNTIVNNQWWEENIASAGIIPVARIHSHHELHAYQSITDYEGLNSGTLEIVMGHILDDQPEFAFWLDERGQNTKDNVFFTKDYGDTISQIPNRKTRFTDLTKSQQLAQVANLNPGKSGKMKLFTIIANDGQATMFLATTDTLEKAREIAKNKLQEIIESSSRSYPGERFEAVEWDENRFTIDELFDVDIVQHDLNEVVDTTLFV